MQLRKTRPFLKWAGNKFRALKYILPLLPKGKRLIEPFAGSAALFLNTDYPENLLAEKNSDLISLFHFIKMEGDDFIRDCSRYFTSDYNHKEHFYQLRQLFNETEEPRLRAILFLYLNRHGFNGLCRYNTSGQFNVPFGRYIKPHFPSEALKSFYQKSQNTAFSLADFRETFAIAGEGDIIYCDPPYVPLSDTANFSGYTHIPFSAADQNDLAQAAQEAAKRGAYVMISNHDTPVTRELYVNAHIHSFKVRRLISARGDCRLPVMELLAVFSRRSGSA